TSASVTCGAPASGSVYTATALMPSRRRVRITRQAISPRLATSTVSNTGASHPEDAEGRVAQRCVGRRGQSQAQHGPGVFRVDHPVVPQPRGRVVGVAMRLVLGA